MSPLKPEEILKVNYCRDPPSWWVASFFFQGNTYVFSYFKKIKEHMLIVEKKSENLERMSKEKLKHLLSQNRAKTAATILVSLDIKSVYGMFSFCGFF
jgi:hypothetical protein